MGPTGSGKSAMAIGIAEVRPTVIINADAMQMVADLRTLSARPTVEEEAQAEHTLYGVLDAAEPTSVARWLTLVAPVIRAAWASGKMPLLVGGTGMYVKALEEGLASVPPIPPGLRENLRRLDPAEIRAKLEARDPAMAATLKPGDSQRNARALEVIEATGQSLRWWQSQKSTPLFPEARFRYFALMPDRAVLYPRLDARFLNMMQGTALDEVRALMVRQLPPSTPILRAHGAPELMAYLQGTMSIDEAIQKAQQNTRNYAKRQLTWLRQQLPNATIVEPGQAAEIFTEL